MSGPTSITLFTLLFILGAVVGSYLNVAGLRFREGIGFRASVIGRSRCPHCGRELRFSELIPLLSFFIQRGKCLSCESRLSLQYPLVELISGLIFVLVPWQLGDSPLVPLWILVFLTFVLISIIDFRQRVIPNQLNLLIAFLGVVVASFYYFSTDPQITGKNTSGTFLGGYALIFGTEHLNALTSHLVGALFGLLLLGGIHFLTRGKAIGLGDVKLSGALGLLLGWPDIGLALALAFVIGALFTLPLIIKKNKKLKDSLPFGPFLTAGVTLVFFFGYHILNGYFSLFNIY